MMKTSPPIILPVGALKTCDTNQPVPISDRDAWGCPGSIQVLSSFNASDRALMFHELTRATRGYTKIDEGMRISIGKLHLKTDSQHVLVMKRIYLKPKYNLAFVQSWLELFYNSGVTATKIEETESSIILTLIWPIIGYGDNEFKPITETVE